jgi:hypothetical protein
MNSVCYICHRPENYDGWVGLGRIVRDCDHCGNPVCSECSECDYDMVGDPPRYVNTQWTCNVCINPAAHIGKDEADYAAACMLQCLSDQAATPFATAVLFNAARHLVEKELASGSAAQLET